MNNTDPSKVEETIGLYCITLTLLSKAFSLLQTGWGLATKDNVKELKEVLRQLKKMWITMDLSWTPKFHCLVEHLWIGGFY